MSRIVSGKLRPDRPLALRLVMDETGVGQPLARSGVHLLTSKGVLQDRGRHGAVVQDRSAWNHVDQEFHRLALVASGNPVFTGYSDAVAYALRARLDAVLTSGVGSASIAYFPPKPELVALLLHVGYANAVVTHKPEAAAAFSRALVAEASGRLESPPIRQAVLWAVREVAWKDEQRRNWPEYLESSA